MKNVVIAGLLIICSSAAFGQENDCARFKNGKFSITDDTVGTTIIEREGSTQIEFGEISKLKLEFVVVWLNECTYTLKLTRILENPNGYELPEDMILTVEITQTKDNSYFQKSTSNLYDMVFESEVILIN